MNADEDTPPKATRRPERIFRRTPRRRTTVFRDRAVRRPVSADPDDATRAAPVEPDPDPHGHPNDPADEHSRIAHALAVGLHQAGRGFEALATATKGAMDATKGHADKAASKALESAKHAIEELKDRTEEAREKGIDFLDRHRDEIIALLVTAGKIALLIGIRRLTARRTPGETGTRAKRLEETARILVALMDEVGKLLSSSPSTLPLLRERFREGDAGEQAIISMLLGPSLVGAPKHAVEVIGEFLASAKDTEAADAIGRRSLAPILDEDPDAIRDVRKLLAAAAPMVRRGALIGLARHMQDKRSRLGDVLGAAVIVLEDHDHEARQALEWLLETASQIDLDATARTIAAGIRRRAPDEADAEELLDALPDDIRDQVAEVLEANDVDGDEAPHGEPSPDEAA